MLKLHNKRGMAMKKAMDGNYNEKGTPVKENIIQKVKKNRYGGGIK